MAIKKKTAARNIQVGPEALGLFFRLWQLINLDGPLCPLPKPQGSPMAGDLERMRRQQVHVDDIKRLCHVPISD
jgi:hypothetical protein